MDLKDYILNEVIYYGSTRSFTSLRETLYQTKANMPIVPISGELERIERANAKISQYSNMLEWN